MLGIQTQATGDEGLQAQMISLNCGGTGSVWDLIELLLFSEWTLKSDMSWRPFENPSTSFGVGNPDQTTHEYATEDHPVDLSGKIK